MVAVVRVSRWRNAKGRSAPRVSLRCTSFSRCGRIMWAPAGPAIRFAAPTRPATAGSVPRGAGLQHPGDLITYHNHQIAALEVDARPRHPVCWLGRCDVKQPSAPSPPQAAPPHDARQRSAPRLLLNESALATLVHDALPARAARCQGPMEGPGPGTGLGEKPVRFLSRLSGFVGGKIPSACLCRRQTGRGRQLAGGQKAGNVIVGTARAPGSIDQLRESRMRGIWFILSLPASGYWIMRF